MSIDCECDSTFPDEDGRDLTEADFGIITAADMAMFKFAATAGADETDYSALMLEEDE